MRIQYTPSPGFLAAIDKIVANDRKLAASWDPSYLKERSGSLYTSTAKVLAMINKKFPKWLFEGADRDGFSIYTDDEALGGVAGPITEDVNEAKQIEKAIKDIYPEAKVATDHVDQYYYINVSGLPLAASIKRSGVIRKRDKPIDHQEMGSEPDPTLMVRTPGVGTVTFDTSMGETMVSNLKAAVIEVSFNRKGKPGTIKFLDGEKAEEWIETQRKMGEAGNSDYTDMKITTDGYGDPKRYRVWWTVNRGDDDYEDFSSYPEEFASEGEAEAWAKKKRITRYEWGIRDSVEVRRKVKEQNAERDSRKAKEIADAKAILKRHGVRSSLHVKAAEDCPFCKEPMFDFTCGCPGEKANVAKVKAGISEVHYTRKEGGKTVHYYKEFNSEEEAKAWIATHKGVAIPAQEEEATGPHDMLLINGKPPQHRHIADMVGNLIQGDEIQSFVSTFITGIEMICRWVFEGMSPTEAFNKYVGEWRPYALGLQNNKQHEIRRRQIASALAQFFIGDTDESEYLAAYKPMSEGQYEQNKGHDDWKSDQASRLAEMKQKRVVQNNPDPERGKGSGGSGLLWGRAKARGGVSVETGDTVVFLNGEGKEETGVIDSSEDDGYVINEKFVNKQRVLRLVASFQPKGGVWYGDMSLTFGFKEDALAFAKEIFGPTMEFIGGPFGSDIKVDGNYGGHWEMDRDDNGYELHFDGWMRPYKDKADTMAKELAKEFQRTRSRY
jgi:hypothetical protein